MTLLPEFIERLGDPTTSNGVQASLGHPLAALVSTLDPKKKTLLTPSLSAGLADPPP